MRLYRGSEDPVFHDYVRALADLMGLRDWTVAISAQPPENPARRGECDPRYGQKFATLRFRGDVFEAEPTKLRETVVHELVHCHLAPMHLFLCDHLRNARDNQAWKAYSLFMEYGVDGTAVAWAERLPLPVPDDEFALMEEIVNGSVCP